MSTLPIGLAAALADRYRIERELGAGGMATVYLAEDLKHHRQVAVKVLRSDLAASLGPGRFLREVSIAANLQHPHILALYDSGEADGFLFYVMPYVEGTSLRQKLLREGELPIPEAVRILRDLADAMAYAHQHGVVHRDIKPENVMLVERHALVMDFGVAKGVAAGQEAVGTGSLTSAGTALGTPAYMAPEQAAGDGHVDHRADLYAWGVVAYELLAGQPPFVRATPQSTLAAQVTALPEPVTQHRANVPGVLAQLVMQCLEKKPADRPQSAEEVLRRLDQVLTPSGGITPTDTQPYQTAAARRARRRWVAAGLGGVVVAFAAVAAGIALWKHTPDTIGPERLTELLAPPGVDFGTRLSLALSPDGTRLAFVGISENGVQQLWIRDLTGGDATPVGGTVGATGPFWSSDGARLGYFAGGKLIVVQSDGSNRVVLADAARPHGGSWSDDGTIAFAAVGGLWVVPAAGGKPELLRPDAGLFAIRRPTWIPRTRSLVFVNTSETGKARMLLLDATSGDTATIGEGEVYGAEFVEPDILVFGRWALAGNTGEGSEVVAQRFDVASRSLLGKPTSLFPRVRSEGTEFTFAVARRSGDVISLPGYQDRAPALVPRAGHPRTGLGDSAIGSYTSAIGHRPGMVYWAHEETGLWSYDSRTGLGTRLGSSFASWFAVAPRDTAIAYFSWDWNPAPRCKIMILTLQTRLDRKVSDKLDCTRRPTGWSEDGHWLMMESGPSWVVDTFPRLGLWAYDLRSDSIVPLFGISSNRTDGAFSPDGRQIAFADDVTGAFEVYVQPFGRDGSPIRVSKQGGRWPRWKADGTELYFLAPNGTVQIADIHRDGTIAPPTTLFPVQDWNRAVYVDIGTAFDAAPDGSQFLLRSAVAPGHLSLRTGWQRRLTAP